MIGKALCVAAAVAVASAAPAWKIIDSDIATIDTGLAFTTDLIGYSGGASNGVGPAIFKTVDGGVTWTTCPAQFGLDLLLLDTDAALNTVVVSSIFGELYSDDAGGSFQPSVGGGTSQSVRFLDTNGDGGLKFGVTGQYGNVQGVGISVDGGKTFKTYDAKLTTEARYGAFPTDTTWYVAAGEWPDSGDDTPTDDPAMDDTAAPIRRHKYKYNGRSLARQKPGAPKAETGSYQAQITVTTDGGATFKTIFNETNTFYFNGIDCQPDNANWCCAVGEADSDSPVPGARIHCTQNGGSTWTRTFFAPGTASSGYSLMEIRFTTNNDVFAVGGELGVLYPSAWFLQSSDGGMTWTNSTTRIAGYYAMGLSVVDPTHAFAALLNPITQESAIAAYE